jgi:hypothetical protein
LFQTFRVYFESFIKIQDDPVIFGREDIFDVGSGYRAFVMFPFSKKDIVLPALRRANSYTHRNMFLNMSEGSDQDTFGTNTVYVMDSSKLDFYQAELCLQFHNNQTGHYPTSYHALKAELLKTGLLHRTGCPSNYVCNASTP